MSGLQGSVRRPSMAPPGLNMSLLTSSEKSVDLALAERERVHLTHQPPPPPRRSASGSISSSPLRGSFRRKPQVTPTDALTAAVDAIGAHAARF